MNRLLASNFARLWKTRIFWVMEIFVAVYSVVMYIDAYMTVEHSGKTIDNWNLYFFNDLMFMGIVMAVFTAFYVGVEYTDGTIRNKIAVGHSRMNIYLANLIVCFVAGIIAFATFSAFSLVMGLVLIGKETVLKLRFPVQIAGIGLFINLAYTALYVMVAMVDAVKARMALINMALAMLMLAVGILVEIKLQPEYYVMDKETGKTRYVTDADEDAEDIVRNSEYLAPGIKRDFYECLNLWTPSSQVMTLLADADYSAKQPLCMMVLAVVFSGSGMWIFIRKEIN